MRELNRLDKPILVSMVEQHLSILEIFDVCHDKLTDREHVDSLQANNNERRTRHVHTQPPKEAHAKSGDVMGSGRGASMPCAPILQSRVIPQIPSPVPPFVVNSGVNAVSNPSQQFINSKEVIYPFKPSSRPIVVPPHYFGE